LISRSDDLARHWAAARRELTNYVTRIVLRKDVAEELVQQAAVRLMEAEAPPSSAEGVRAWLFRVVTNLGIDHVRRHSTQRENAMAATKETATADAAFMAEMEAMRGDDEHRAMAKQHLSVCFSCTLRVFPAQRAAALLLVEVFDFTLAEAAEMLEARPTQVKNWIQECRAGLDARYAETCALVTKKGVCHECAELSEYFNGASENPLEGTSGATDARLAILRERRETALGPWHTKLMVIVDELLRR
jgi:RNA polymerase sigma-70 factor (ECF subfamily)